MTRITWFAAVAILMFAPMNSRADFTLTLGGGSDQVVIDVSNNVFTVSSSNVSGITVGTVLQAGNSYGTNHQLSIASMMNGGLLASNGSTYMDVCGLTFDGYTAQFTGASSNNPGSATLGQLMLENFVIQGSANDAKSFGFSVSEGNFTAPSPYRNFEAIFDAINITGGAQVTQTAQYSDQDGNNAVLTYSGSTYSDQTGGGGSINSSSSYTLTDSVTITGLGSESVSNIGIDAIVHAPAPSGLVYAATFVPVLGLLFRRWRGPHTAAIA